MLSGYSGLRKGFGNLPPPKTEFQLYLDCLYSPLHSHSQWCWQSLIPGTFWDPMARTGLFSTPRGSLFARLSHLACLSDFDLPKDQQIHICWHLMSISVAPVFFVLEGLYIIYPLQWHFGRKQRQNIYLTYIVELEVLASIFTTYSLKTFKNW